MLCGTMLGKLPLVLTSFANLTTDESFEAVPIATDYEKLIPIHYFYFPASLRSGVKIRTVMKCGCVCAHSSAFCLLPKNRSMTMALRSAAFRPHERAALRLITSGPVSTATHSASGKITLLPSGILFGSTAQCSSRSRVPFQAACSPEPSRCQ